MSDYERKLFSLAVKGSIEAFEELAEAYYKKVYNIIHNTLGNEADVSGLTQEVFVRVFKSLKCGNDESVLAILIYKATGEVCLEARSRIRLIS